MKLGMLITGSMTLALVSLGAAAGCEQGPEPQVPDGAEVAQAQGDLARPPMRMFAQADTNGDGQITRDEMLASAKERFDKADTNHDGVVEGTELNAMPSRGPGRGGAGRMQRLDANGDGRISADEHNQAVLARFTAMDSNNDGVVTQAEANAKRGHAPGQGRGRGKGPGRGVGKGPGAHGPMGGFGPNQGWLEKLFSEADTNHDGKVTRAELDAVRAKHFAAMDTNHDNVIDAQEASAWQAKHRATIAGDRFKQLDKNGDGALSADEVPPGLQQRFGRVDANGDGRITAEEMAAKPMGRGGAGAGLMRMDANNDGKVTHAEFAQKPERWFERADANHDGSVTRQELDAMLRGPARR